LEINLLNKAGRLCLAKSLPMYAMQSLWLPQSVCDYMDKTIRQFLWSKDGHSRGWSMVSWKDVTKSKYKGGLGIRLARDANVASLGKVVAGFV
jgi:hypothetical protein